jgi:transcriptional regulator with XRE-family HTH domain
VTGHVSEDRGSRAVVAERDVGGRLRAERSSRGMSLRSLAKAVGISPSALSQIETGRSKPSVETLYALVSELGISLDALFAYGPVDETGTSAGAEAPAMSGAGSHGQVVQKQGERKRITLESGVVWERLTPTSEAGVDFLHVTYEVGGASSSPEALLQHSGREYGLVLDGNLHVTVGSEEHDLGPGDSIAFDSTVPHRLENAGRKPVHAVWFALERGPADPGPAAHEEG